MKLVKTALLSLTLLASAPALAMDSQPPPKNSQQNSQLDNKSPNYGQEIESLNVKIKNFGETKNKDGLKSLKLHLNLLNIAKNLAGNLAGNEVISIEFIDNINSQLVKINSEFDELLSGLPIMMRQPKTILTDEDKSYLENTIFSMHYQITDKFFEDTPLKNIDPLLKESLGKFFNCIPPLISTIYSREKTTTTLYDPKRTPRKWHIETLDLREESQPNPPPQEQKKSRWSFLK